MFYDNTICIMLLKLFFFQDLNTLAPRKPDWDLKRDIEKRMAKLERRTQRAIAELIRERLRGEKNIDLASAVNEGARANAQVDIDEE